MAGSSPADDTRRKALAAGLDPSLAQRVSWMNPPAGSAGAPSPGFDVRDLSGASPFSFPKLDKVQGLVVHHTGGRGTPEGVMETFRQRGLPAQYVMDREGVVYRTLPDGMRGQHIRPSEINGLSNANTVGIEIIAKDDADLTPAQRQAMLPFLTYAGERYGFPAANVFGHGEINSHKQSTEGSSVVSDWRAANRIAMPAPTDHPAASRPIPMAARTLRGYAGADQPNDLEGAFAEASRVTGIPAPIIRAMARQESGLDPNAVGKSGEVGLLQIKPSTAANPGFGVAPVDPATLRDPKANAVFGAQYLAARAKAAGAKDWTPQELAKGLAAYNGGGDPNYAANVMRYLPGGIPLNPQLQEAAARGGNLPSNRLRMTVQKPAAEPVSFDAPLPAGTEAAGPMSPEAFRSAVFNAAPVSNNEALDFRLKDDAVQRGQASWDAALKAAGPQITPEQAQLAKLLTGAWA